MKLPAGGNALATSSASPAAASPTPLPINRAPLAQRAAAAVVAAVCLTMLVVGAWLKPDPAGHGTHRQLGLPACGFLIATGKPCPTCGMTTAFSHATHGRFVSSARTQPGGLAVAIGASALFAVCLHTACTGSRAFELCGKLMTPKALWIAAGGWLASWVYAIAVWPAG